MLEYIKEKNTFFQNDIVFKKYFSERKQSKMEKKKLKEFKMLIKDFCKKVYGDDNYNSFLINYASIGYLEDYGYYTITDADRGYCDVFNFGENINEAFKNIIIDVLFNHSINYEFENREILEQDFIKRFDIEYFGCLYFAENSLKHWNKYYDGNIPDNIINYYENYLNSIWWSEENNINWSFNLDTKKFNYKINTKIKKI